MSQGILRLRRDGGEPERYEAQIDTWDNPDGGAFYEIYFSGAGEEGMFSGSCQLERVGKWKYEGIGRWRDENLGDFYNSSVKAELKLVGKLLVLEGHWFDHDDLPGPYDLYIEIENR
ncbi:hypothetical protein [Dyella japonica]|uniref:Uncharacterized protein n=1 Tax=Dyella japonica A8 TaxID=1217721 RepID=A0A075K0G5_9GAMM|nr:hypothetical protein [Dyella japonica]AIF47325.1 hypothetical protein HY57_08595 [Dyella japonica A8]